MTESKDKTLKLNRRQLMAGMGVGAVGMFGGGLYFGNVEAAPSSGLKRTITFNQVELPEDAAPADQQIFIAPDDSTIAKVLDFYVKVYERPSAAASDVFSEPLVRLNRDFDILPAAAESWQGSADGMTWTFKIREDLTWSDGNPVTANDWVASFRNGADPAFAWDFTWFFQGVLKNWNEALDGSITPDQIGVNVGANDYELVIETVAPAPYIPSMLLYSNPLSAAALAANGPLYNTDVSTAVSSGPYILTEWTPDQQIVYSRNEAYTGTLPGLVNQIQIKLTSASNFFIMYQNNEIDFMRDPAPADLTIMQNDETTAKEIYQGVGDFPTWYIFFDVTLDPWKDLKVRQAWSHAIDRDTLASQILGPNGIPAYSWLAPGFPGNQTEAIKSIQGFDPELAQSLLAEAGFENGDGFPKQQMWLRAPNPLDKTTAQALASMIKTNLNIDVELLEKTSEEFTSALNAKPTQIPLGFVRYGMDFFDPFNMLSVWLSGGRHSWTNSDYDTQVRAAAEFLGDPAERITMFQDAEKILITDVPGVFVYHGTEVQLIKPWVKGPFLDPDKNGIQAMHWPSFATMSTVPAELYIGADAPSRG